MRVLSVCIYCTNSIIWFGAMMHNFLKVCQSLVRDFPRDFKRIDCSCLHFYTVQIIMKFTYSLFHLHLNFPSILRTNLMTSYQLAYGAISYRAAWVSQMIFFSATSSFRSSNIWISFIHFFMPFSVPNIALPHYSSIRR